MEIRNRLKNVRDIRMSPSEVTLGYSIAVDVILSMPRTSHPASFNNGTTQYYFVEIVCDTHNSHPICMFCFNVSHNSEMRIM